MTIAKMSTTVGLSEAEKRKIIEAICSSPTWNPGDPDHPIDDDDLINILFLHYPGYTKEYCDTQRLYDTGEKSQLGLEKTEQQNADLEYLFKKRKYEVLQLAFEKFGVIHKPTDQPKTPRDDSKKNKHEKWKVLKKNAKNKKQDTSEVRLRAKSEMKDGEQDTSEDDSEKEDGEQDTSEDDSEQDGEQNTSEDDSEEEDEEQDTSEDDSEGEEQDSSEDDSEKKDEKQDTSDDDSEKDTEQDNPDDDSEKKDTEQDSPDDDSEKKDTEQDNPDDDSEKKDTEQDDPDDDSEKKDTEQDDPDDDSEKKDTEQDTSKDRSGSVVGFIASRIKATGQMLRQAAKGVRAAARGSDNTTQELEKFEEGKVWPQFGQLYESNGDASGFAGAFTLSQCSGQGASSFPQEMRIDMTADELKLAAAEMQLAADEAKQLELMYNLNEETGQVQAGSNAAIETKEEKRRRRANRHVKWA